MNILFYGIILLCVIPAAAILVISAMGMASPAPATPTLVPQDRKDKSRRNHLSALLAPAALACILAVGGCDSAITVADDEAEEVEEEAEGFLAVAGTGDFARLDAVLGFPAKLVYRVSVPALGGARLQYDGPDPGCEWPKGGSKEELQDFVSCWENNRDCALEMVLEDDGKGGKEVSAVHIHCEQ